MNARAVIATGVAVAAMLPVAARAGDGPAPTAARPGALVVALGLQSPTLQAGVVRGRDVILARGFEVELARTLARRLGGRVDRFVYVPSETRLLASSGDGWQFAIAGITPSHGSRTGVDYSAPYLTTDVAVVVRNGLPRPRRLTELRSLLLCSVRRGDGAAVVSKLAPTQPPLLVAGTERLRTLMRTGACDAALVSAAQAGGFVAGGSVGKAVGRIARGDGLVVAVPRASAGIDVGAVDRALGQLRRDGTLGRLARTWLGLDPAALPVLR